MPEILVTKIAEPQNYLPGDLGEAYKNSLEVLPGEEERIGEGVDGTIKVRHVPEDEVQRQLAELNSDRRPHIVRAERDEVATTFGSPVEDEVGTSAVRLSAAQARALHGVDKAHERGKRGAGRKICVIDTGLPQALQNRYSAKFGYLGSVVSNEPVWDESGSSHGGWCTSCIIGIAPEAQQMVIKALSSSTGSGSYSGIINAVNIAVEQGATEINMSLGGPKSETLNSACRAAAAKGVSVVVAAGNEQRGKTSFVADSTSPASELMCETVGAKNSDKLTADFSNHGNCLDIGAIGFAIECPDRDLMSGFWNGTSMASPHACGMSALVTGNLKALNASAEDTHEAIHVEGAGFANVNAALDKIEPPTPEPVPEPAPPVEEPPKDCGPKPRWRDYFSRAAAMASTEYKEDLKGWYECTGKQSAIARILGR